MGESVKLDLIWKIKTVWLSSDKLSVRYSKRRAE